MKKLDMTGVRFDMAGAHQHHQLDLLVVVLLLLEQPEMDVVGSVRSELYGGSGCWTSERRMSELKRMH